MASWMVIWAALGQVDFSGGFGTTTGLQLNGNAAAVGGRLQLTPAVNDNRGSAFFTTPQAVSSFATTFTFEFNPGSNPMADGICFVIQRAGATSLGVGGGSQGYAGILTSVAVKFDIYPNAGSYTGIYSNGAAPDQPETVISPGLDFHASNVCRADLIYDGTTLDVTITDTVTAATASQSYAVDIPSVIGGSTAFVGFTAATGGLNAIQEIAAWTFTPPPPAPATLSATQNEIGQVTLTWAAAVGATSYQVFRSAATGGPYTQIATVAAPTLTYTDAVATGPWYYVVRAVGPGGSSGNSPEAMGFSVAAPRVSDHEEGLVGDRCACGSATRGPHLAWIAALALLVARRRR